MPNKKKLYFCTNTKMSKGLQESMDYLDELRQLTIDLNKNDVELAVMLPYTALYPAAAQRLSKNNILLGAQNVCGEQEYTFTGEISARMLSELGAECVMAGHSDRRHKLGETNNDINKKVSAAAAHGLIVFLSISETEYEKNAGISDETLNIQLKQCLYGISRSQTAQLRILYEPAWAIGRPDCTVSPDYVEERHLAIRSCLNQLYGSQAGSGIPLIYGGSVDINNAFSLIDQAHVDGLGIGRSAWNASNFNQIIRMVMAHVSS